jgi:hypothetical protein
MTQRPRRGGLLLPFVLICILFGTSPSTAQQGSNEFDTLRKEIEELRRLLTEKQKKLEDLERRIEAIQTTVSEKKPAIQASASPEEKAPIPAKETEPKRDLLSYRTGGATLRLMDVSFDGVFAAGASTLRDEPLQFLQGGGHDPRKRGFTVQNVELSFSGAVDPYLNAEAHIVHFLDPLTGESKVELEEAFFTTQKLPYGLQLKGGHFFTEFGRLNPQHPHQWDWQDQPVINTRLFGPDGMRGPGFRLSWLTPFPWFSELSFGMQNANGETMASFLANEEFFDERPIGGRPFVNRDVRSLKDLAYHARSANSWDLSDEVSTVLGFSGLYGPNATGPDGKTWIYGADIKMKWRPVNNFRGWPFLLFQSEIMKRDYQADRFTAPGIFLPSDTLRDWGFYTQLLYGFQPNWAAGIRYDFATGSGKSANVDLAAGTGQLVSRNRDPFRGDRHRISPLVVWQLTEFTRFRLQYNYDRIKGFDQRSANSVWLGGEFMFGAHTAHKY